MSEIIAISDGLFSLIIVAWEDGEVWTNQRLGRAELSQSEASIDSQATWVAAASISRENLKQILTRNICKSGTKKEVRKIRGSICN